MEKAIQFTIKVLLTVQLLAFFSCGDDIVVLKKHYFVKPENKAWLVNDTLPKSFDMVDNNGITHSFSGGSTKQEFSEGGSGILFFTTKKTYTEYFDYGARSNYGTSFSMSLYASTIGDDITLRVDDISIHCNLTTNEIVSFDCGRSNVKWTQSNEKDMTSLFVKANLLSALTVRNKEYKEVLYCRLTDNINVLDKKDITEIYYAKGIGLIKFKIKSGIVIERISDQKVL
jgi:hypothetical protein